MLGSQAEVIKSREGWDQLTLTPAPYFYTKLHTSETRRAFRSKGGVGLIFSSSLIYLLTSHFPLIFFHSENKWGADTLRSLENTPVITYIVFVDPPKLIFFFSDLVFVL